MKASEKAIALIAEYEGFRGSAYKCPAGIWTCGYGHTLGVTAGVTCSKEQALAWLAEDVGGAEKYVSALVKVPLSQNQFDALVSFVFNLGAGSLKSSTMLRLINAGNYSQAANEFGKWVMAGGKTQPGLVRRRAAEKKMFEGG